MSDVFTTTVFPVVQRFARVRFRDEEQQALMLVLAWWYWSRREQDFPPTAYAQLAARAVAGGRDLPGCGTSRRDALHRAESGGGMDEARDWYPGPEQIVMDRERYTALLARASDRDLILIEMFETGAKNKDVAAALGISQGRVTQIRQGLMNLEE